MRTELADVIGRVNVEQAAALKKCSRRTIYNMITDGRLQTVRTGAGLMVTVASLKAAQLHHNHGKRRT